jgi:hypothetical protein
MRGYRANHSSPGGRGRGNSCLNITKELECVSASLIQYITLSDLKIEGGETAASLPKLSPKGQRRSKNRSSLS